MTKTTTQPLCDVLAVNIKTSIVRLMAQGKTRPNAEASVNMAVMRRGVDEEFYTVVAADTYKDGEKWEGDRVELPPEPEEDPDYYQVGNTMFPRGPRGLDR